MISLAAVNAPDWLALGSRLDELPAFADALDIRVSNPGRGPSKNELELSRIARELNLEVRCHGWAGRRGPAGTAVVTAADGERQGKLFAEHALALEAARCGVNAERDVWRGPGRTPHPHAGAYLDAFATAFYESNRAAWLDYVGFAVPSWHLRGGNDQLGQDLRMRFRRVCIMAYQTTPAALTRTFDRADKLWVEHAPYPVARPTDAEPWLGVGRLDAAGHMVGSPEGSRLAWERYGRLCWYVGFGAIGQVFDGHARHPALAALGRELKGD